MPFYNIFVDWAVPIDESEQFNRMQWSVERALHFINKGGNETLIVGTTSLSMWRSRLTFQTEKAVEASDFEGMLVDGSSRTVLSPVRLGDSGFPLLEMGSDAVEIDGLKK